MKLCAAPPGTGILRTISSRSWIWCRSFVLHRRGDRAPAAEGDQIDREFRRERFADYVIVLHLWGGLPDDLLESFWEHAPSGVRQHAMWYLALNYPRPTCPTRCVRAAFPIGIAVSMLLGAPIIPDAFRAELGAVGQWSLRDRIDDQWLADQLFNMLQADFVPTDAFSVVDWLAKIAPRNATAQQRFVRLAQESAVSIRGPT